MSKDNEQTLFPEKYNKVLKDLPDFKSSVDGMSEEEIAIQCLPIKEIILNIVSQDSIPNIDSAPITFSFQILFCL